MRQGVALSAARELGAWGSGQEKSPESPDSKEALVVRPLSYARINVVRFKGFDLSPKAPPAIPNSYLVVRGEATPGEVAPQWAKRNRPRGGSTY